MLPDLPLEILHLIIFDLWILDHRDIAAARAACSELRNAVLPTGLDLDKWLARAGPEWCMGVSRRRASLKCHVFRSPCTFAASDNHAIRWASVGDHAKAVAARLSDPVAKQNAAICNANRPSALLKCYVPGSPYTPAANDNRAIRWASVNGHYKAVAALLADPRVDPAAENNYAIRNASPNASSNGHAEIVAALLADGRADPAACGNYAIIRASMNGKVKVVAALLADGRADPAAKHSDAMCRASSLGHAEVVAALLADGRVDPTSKDNYAIRYASMYGHAEVVALLLADPRFDPSGGADAAMFWASRNGHTEVVALLMSDERVASTWAGEE